MSVLVPYVGITNTIPELVESGTSGFSAVSNGYFNGLTTSVKQTYNSSNPFPLESIGGGMYDSYFICPKVNFNSDTLLSNNSFKAGSDQLTATTTKSFSGPGELILTNFYVTKDANLTINKVQLVVDAGGTKYIANVGSDNNWDISDDVVTAKFSTRCRKSSGSSTYQDDYLRFNGFFMNPNTFSQYYILASASYSSKVYVDGRDITSTISGFSTGTNSYKIPFNDTIRVETTRTIKNTPTQVQQFSGMVAYIRCKADSTSSSGSTYYYHSPNYNSYSYTVYPTSAVTFDLEKVYYDMDSSIYQYSYYLY